MAKAYYNENNKFAANWLRNLISEGLIADGDVDDRSIKDVEASDLDGYTQAHFFAGIGGWSLALRMAGWSDDRPVWTGSCPCQPFSNAGARKGTDDERHLFPVWRELIAQCKPSTVFGEQVASKAGRAWLGSVFDSLEALGYAGAGADLGAASVGAPQVRQRLFWVAVSGCGVLQCGRGPREALRETSASQGEARERERRGPNAWSGRSVLQARGLDGRVRRFESSALPLVDGVSERMGQLRAYGNAIVPQVAAQFVGAYMDTLNA